MSGNLFDPPPYAAGSETSKEAAESLADDVATIRLKVYRTIRERGGATCDEVEIALAMRHQTVSAAIWHLKKAGWLTATDRKRITRSGRKAFINVDCKSDSVPECTP